MKTKTCSKCGKAKPLDQFHKNKNSKDGHLGVCKACRSDCNKSTPAKRVPMVCQSCGKAFSVTEQAYKHSQSQLFGLCLGCQRRVLRKQAAFPLSRQAKHVEPEIFRSIQHNPMGGVAV